jgi:hypothetical protein
MNNTPPLPFMGRGWGGVAAPRQNLQCLDKNNLRGADGIAQNIHVPKPQHAISAFLNPSVTFAVMRCAERCVVDPTVDFHNEPRFVAEKISDEGPERSLPPKVRSPERQPTQLNPERAFSRRHRLPQLSGGDHSTI